MAVWLSQTAVAEAPAVNEISIGIDVFVFLVAARATHFAAVFILYGSSLFWAFMAVPGRSDQPSDLDPARHATIVLLRWAAPVAAISGVAWLVGIIAAMTGSFDAAADPATLHLFFFETQFGPVAAVRLALLVASTLTVFGLEPRHILRTCPLVGAALLISQAWLGHAAEGGTGLHGAAMLSTYGVHMLAAGAWVGGLPPLLFTLRLEDKADRAGGSWTASAVLSRYSAMAIVAVILIVISGGVSAGFRVGDEFDRLLATDYGNVLFVKFSVVMLMLAFACVNRFSLMPHLNKRNSHSAKALGQLRACIAIELVLAVSVLCIAAVLGITPPPQ